MTSKVIFIICGLLTLSACQLFDTEVVVQQEVVDAPTIDTFEQKIHLLANDLISNPSYDYKKYSTLITTFVWSDTLTSKDIRHPFKHLGNLLAESLKVKLVQKEAQILEHKSTKFVAMDSQASYFLSRNTEHLKTNINADYVIAGTFNQVPGGAMVYAEVIEFNSGKIVSAGQNFIPESLISQVNQVTTQDGMLFRNAKLR